jgi:hypothetical protein
MADTTITSRGFITNGVSIGTTYTLTAADVTNTAIVFNFNPNNNVNYFLVASAILRTAAGSVVNVTAKSLNITYPAKGKVRVAMGTHTAIAGEWAAGNFIDLVVQRAN